MLHFVDENDFSVDKRLVDRHPPNSCAHISLIHYSPQQRFAKLILKLT